MAVCEAHSPKVAKLLYKVLLLDVNRVSVMS